LDFLLLPIGFFSTVSIPEPRNPNKVAAFQADGHSHTAEIFHRQNAESETAADDNEWSEAKRETNRN